VDGTVKATPDGIAPAAVEVVDATVVPSNFTVIAELAAKSEPDTVTTVEPAAPEVGLKIIETVTVKVAEAESEEASVAVTVSAPEITDGTVKVTPDGIAPAAVEVVDATVDVPNFTVIAELAAKPLPETVTVEPTAPEVGFKLIAEVTVNVAVGELVPSLNLTV
jgi:hypothetical protein